MRAAARIVPLCVLAALSLPSLVSSSEILQTPLSTIPTDVPANSPDTALPVHPKDFLPWSLVLGLSGLLLARMRTPPSPHSTPAVHSDAMGVSKAIADALQEAKEAAESANRAKDDFLAALSHELRSPLNPVLLLASEYARSSELPQRLREDFQIILHNVRLQARLIDDLLDLNRIQRGGLSISARRLHLKTVLEEVCKGLQSEAQERSVTLVLECSPQDCVIRGDNTRLNQIFGNILRNAIKFAPKDTPVHVRLEPTPGTAHVTITDSGPGILADDLKRIFTPFVQAPHAGSTAGACGLGLGLAIAQRLVERHRGSIWAESEGLGRGAVFHIELPLEPAETATQQTSDLGGKPREKNPSTEALRVLLLEDHESTRLILSRMLQKHGFETLTAPSIDAASRVLAEEKIDVLLSDLGLPDGEGFHLPKLWKERIRMGCIALSGFGMENDIARSHACGFDRHLTKPVEFQALLEAMDAVTRLHPRDTTAPA